MLNWDHEITPGEPQVRCWRGERERTYQARAAGSRPDHQQICKGALHCGPARFRKHLPGVRLHDGRAQFIIFETVKEAMDHLNAQH